MDNKFSKETSWKMALEGIFGDEEKGFEMTANFGGTKLTDILAEVEISLQ